MNLPYSWGQPTEAPGVFAIGGGEWMITWSPHEMHPYAAQWLQWSSGFGPAGATAPHQDLWSYTLMTRDLN